MCQRQVSRAGTSNYIPQYLWDVITCSCPWHLLQANNSTYLTKKMSQVLDLLHFLCCLIHVNLGHICLLQVNFGHICQGYFTGTGGIIWLSLNSSLWVILPSLWKLSYNMILLQNRNTMSWKWELTNQSFDDSHPRFTWVYVKRLNKDSLRKTLLFLIVRFISLWSPQIMIMSIVQWRCRLFHSLFARHNLQEN